MSVAVEDRTRFDAGLCSDCDQPRRQKSPRCDVCRERRRVEWYRTYKRRRRTEPEFIERDREIGRRYREMNRDKRLAAMREWHRKNRHRQYGLDQAAFAAMAMEQGLACAICRRITSLHVDHDHSTGRVRALLCGKCNRGIGMFDESPDVLAKAIAYITEHKGGE